MADKKISQLDTLETMADDDLVVVVDVSDTTQAATGTTKKTFKTQLKGDKGDKGDTGTNGTNGTNGTDGDDAYVYIAYASDDSGADFTTTFNADLNYIAVKNTTTAIASPAASDFTGLWKNYKGATGAKGDKGDQGIQGIQGEQGPAGTGTGDVVGPASAVGDNFASFNSTTGKLIKDSGSKASDFATASHNHTGVYAPALGTDDNYVTDAEKTAIGTIGNKVAKDAAAVTGNFMQFDASGNAHDYGWNPDSFAVPADLPVKASGAEVDTGTDDAKFVTAKALKDSHNVPSVAPGTSGNVLTSNGTDWTSAAPSASGSSLWTLMPGTPVRTGNTTFTVTGDVTAYVAKGMIIKWTESSAVKCAMVSIPSTYGAPNTTITIVGDAMASIDASSLKYCMLGAEMFKKDFAVAGTIGETGTDVMNAYYATEPMRVIGADLQVGTAGTTNNTTVDINKGGTTMFTTKPTLATTVTSSPTPFTADSEVSLALGDKVTIDVDAVQTTAAVDLYVQLYLFPTRYLSLS